MSDHLSQLEALESSGLRELGAVTDSGGLEQWRIVYLGASGKVKAAKAALKDVPKDLKPAVGQRTNQVGAALEQAFKEKQGSLGSAAARAPAGPRVDVTEPGLVW